MHDAELNDLEREHLILKSEISAFRMHLAARRLTALLLKGAGFNPDQPRDDHGRWTNVGVSGSEGSIILTGGRSGYPIDILEEDALGGHTFEKHVAKPEECLKARILGSRTNIAGIVTFGEARAGSFTSIEATNKLVNSTISQNQE